MNVSSSPGLPASVDREDERLRSLWDKRYNEFSLRESGIYGLDAEFLQYFYRCKASALNDAYQVSGIADRDFDVIDIGCGQGYFAEWLRTAYPRARYTGVDISERVVGHLRSRLPSYNWIAANFTRDQFNLGRQADIVQSIDVLHLLIDDDVVRQGIGNLARMVRPGGTLILTCVLPPFALNVETHMRFRPIDFYQLALADAGMRVARVIPIFHCLPDRGPRLRVLHRLFGRMSARTIYAIDRVSRRLRLSQRFQSHDSRMNVLVCRHIGE
jgi:SAM-dependent methyltransferase